MSTIEENTCIRFNELHENTVPKHHLEIRNKLEPMGGGIIGGVSESAAPRLRMSFSKRFGGDQSSLIIHELGHVLGLAHTQRRTDREEYVHFKEECVEEGKKSNFDILEKNEEKTFEVPYKCNSMMHYTSWRFSKGGGCKTLEPLPGMCELDIVGGAGPIKEDWDLIKMAHCT